MRARIEVRDTIAAIASGTGGGVGIIRMSGPDAEAIGRRLVTALPHDAESHRLYLCDANDPATGQPLDRVLVTVMRAPRSYTGETVVELHGHGGAANLAGLLDAIIRAGARMADPGEFTRRAFLSGRIDLIQAEAVAQLIAARSARAVRLAQAQLRGDLAKRVSALRERLVAHLAEVEARIDFPDESLDFVPDAALSTALAELAADTVALAATHSRGRLVAEGMDVALVGRANAGKSSLFNALAGEERALVDSVPGTTRDFLEAEVDIAGVRTLLVDTAGERESASSSAGEREPASSPAGEREPASSSAGEREPASSSAGEREPASSPAGEREPASSSAGEREPASSPAGERESASSPAGEREPASSPAGEREAQEPAAGERRSEGTLERASADLERRGLELGRRRRRRADVTLLVVDGTVGFGDLEARLLAESGPLVLVAWNKADLQPEIRGVPAGVTVLPTSAVGDADSGLSRLREAIADATSRLGDEDLLISSARQRDALDEAAAAVRAAAGLLAAHQPPELAAVDLRLALDRFGQLTGESVEEAVLDALFARFCIGK